MHHHEEVQPVAAVVEEVLVDRDLDAVQLGCLGLLPGGGVRVAAGLAAMAVATAAVRRVRRL